MLYFSFLRYTAFAFGTLCVVLGLPLLCIYAKNGDFFVGGTFRKATLGNYGPVYVEGAMLAPAGVVRRLSSFPCHHERPLAMPVWQVCGAIKRCLQ